VNMKGDSVQPCLIPISCCLALVYAPPNLTASRGPTTKLLTRVHLVERVGPVQEYQGRGLVSLLLYLVLFCPDHEDRLYGIPPFTEPALFAFQLPL